MNYELRILMQKYVFLMEIKILFYLPKSHLNFTARYAKIFRMNADHNKKIRANPHHARAYRPHFLQDNHSNRKK